MHGRPAPMQTYSDVLRGFPVFSRLGESNRLRGDPGRRPTRIICSFKQLVTFFKVQTKQHGQRSSSLHIKSRHGCLGTSNNSIGCLVSRLSVGEDAGALPRWHEDSEPFAPDLLDQSQHRR